MSIEATPFKYPDLEIDPLVYNCGSHVSRPQTPVPPTSSHSALTPPPGEQSSSSSSSVNSNLSSASYSRDPSSSRVFSPTAQHNIPTPTIYSISSDEMSSDGIELDIPSRSSGYHSPDSIRRADHNNPLAVPVTHTEVSHGRPMEVDDRSDDDDDGYFRHARDTSRRQFIESRKKRRGDGDEREKKRRRKGYTGTASKSSNKESPMYVLSGPSTSEHIPPPPTIGWTPQMHAQHEGSASSNSGSRHPQSRISLASPPANKSSVEQPHGTPVYTRAQQYQAWKDIPLTSPIAPGHIRLFIPQRMNNGFTLPKPLIIFEVEHPYEWGIGLDDALKCRTERLADSDVEVSGLFASIRLEWPGVSKSWEGAIWTRVFRHHFDPIITKATLAKVIAECVQDFIRDNAGNPINDEKDTDALRYKVGYGPHDVKLEDLILVSLHPVGLTSWQPHLRLKRQIA